jgi:RHS repeat-associated protein
LTLHIPLFSYPQRGPLPGGYDLVLNTKNFFVVQNCNPQTGTCADRWGINSYHGVHVVQIGLPGFTYKYKNGSYDINAITWDGGSHQMGYVGATLESLDATGIWMNNQVPPTAIADDHGNISSYNSTSGTTWSDTNGNFYTFPLSGASYTDTMGRIFTLSTSSAPDNTGCTGPNPITGSSITIFPGPNGVNRQVKTCGANITIQTNFQATNEDQSPNIIELPPEVFGIMQTVLIYDGVSWATSPAWTFEYNDRNPTDPSNINYGSLTKVTLPTGGSISYTYGNYALCNDGNGSTGYIITPVSRGVTSRTEDANDGTGPHTTFYRGDFTTDPQGNDTVHTFILFNCSAYDSEVDYYQGSRFTGTLLKKVQTDYTYNPHNPFDTFNDGAGTVLNVVPIRTTTTIGSQTTKVEKDWDQKFLFGGNYFSYGNVLEEREFDFLSGGTYPLLKRTDYSFLAFNNPSYLALNMLDRVASVTVYNGAGSQVAQTTYGYDESGLLASGVASQHGPAPGGSYRGNVTSVKQWLNTTGGTLNTTTTYFDSGISYQRTDPKGNVTTFHHSQTYVGAYVTQTNMPTTSSVQHVISGSYDFNTGKLTSFTDQNGQVSSYAYDALSRVISASFPDGGQTVFNYPNLTTVETKRQINGGLWLDSYRYFDGLGRSVEATLPSDPDGLTVTELTQYDSLGRVNRAYNPTRCPSPTVNCETTWGYKTYGYDALNRVTSLTEQDGSIVSTAYNGNCTTVTDEAGNKRTSCTDGAGRLSQVFEDPSNHNFETDYLYDALDNLSTVNQKGGSTNSANWRTRTFTYDSLSRLTVSTNPESGTTTYGYDSDGNVVSKTSPAPNQTGPATVTLSYCYDALNRISSKAYTAQSCPITSPVATYSYDQTSFNGLTIANGIGRRTGMTDTAGTEAWSYDKMGRIASDQRTTNALTRNYSYLYNLDGSLYSATHPDGLVVTFQPGGAGRPLSETSGDARYAFNVHYAPNGSVCYRQQDWGQESTVDNTFNNRLQPVRVYMQFDYNFTPPAPCSTPSQLSNIELDFTYSFVDANGHNNGNVASITMNNDYSRSQQFSYDSLNRISTAQTLLTYSGYNGPARCWGEQFGYDPWGNLLNISGVSTAYTGCTQENLSVAVNTKNQIVGNTYDAAGNLSIAQPGSVQYTYDAENRLISTAGQTYLYDGDGKRVEKAATGTPLVPNKLYWYGAEDNPVLETDATGNELYRYFRFLGTLVAREEGANDWVDHYGVDALGNVRFLYGNQGEWDMSDYYPFGAERVVLSQNNNNTRKFTSKERDYESGLDNLGARYMNSGIGRFMSVDPKQLTAHLLDPQTLNRYTYTRNNPLVYVDPDGKDLAKAWSDLKSSFNTLYVKLSAGVGLEVKVKRVGIEAKAGVAYKANIKTSEESVLKLSKSLEGGVSATDAGHTIGNTKTAEQTVLTIQNNGRLTGEEPPVVSNSSTMGPGTASADELGIGAEIGLGLLLGGEVGITRAGWDDLKAAVSEVKDSLTDPGPPPALKTSPTQSSSPSPSPTQPTTDGEDTP